MNDCKFTGRLTAAPELKYTKTGKEVCSFSLAIDTGWGDSKQTYFPRFVAWGGQAKYVAKCGKGDKLLISRAEFTEREYTNKQGQQVKVAEFVVREVEAMGAPRAAAQQPQQPTWQPAVGESDIDAGADLIDDEGDLPF